MRDLIVILEHALLIVEERLREQQAEGVEMPPRMDRRSLATLVLVAAEGLNLEREGGRHGP